MVVMVMMMVTTVITAAIRVTADAEIGNAGVAGVIAPVAIPITRGIRAAIIAIIVDAGAACIIAVIIHGAGAEAGSADQSAGQGKEFRFHGGYKL